MLRVVARRRCAKVVNESGESSSPQPPVPPEQREHAHEENLWKRYLGFRWGAARFSSRSKSRIC
jgi:hypothetical protein